MADLGESVASVAEFHLWGKVIPALKVTIYAFLDLSDLGRLDQAISSSGIETEKASFSSDLRNLHSWMSASKNDNSPIESWDYKVMEGFGVIHWLIRHKVQNYVPEGKRMIRWTHHVVVEVK